MTEKGQGLRGTDSNRSTRGAPTSLNEVVLLSVMVQCGSGHMVATAMPGREFRKDARLIGTEPTWDEACRTSGLKACSIGLLAGEEHSKHIPESTAPGSGHDISHKSCICGSRHIVFVTGGEQGAQGSVFHHQRSHPAGPFSIPHPYPDELAWPRTPQNTGERFQSCAYHSHLH